MEETTGTIEKNRQFKKNFIWNILGTGFNAFNSLFFMIAVTRINGVENAGIYAIAYSTACILYMIGIYAGRIYQVTENNKDITNKDYIFNRAMSCGIIFIISIIFVTIKRYDIFKSSIFVILALYKALEAFSDVFYGILQKNDYLDKAGKSCFMKAIFSVIAFIIMDILTKNLVIACTSIVIVYLMIILIYDVRQSNEYIKDEKKPEMKNIMNIFKGGFFPFAISFLGVYITNAQKYSIDNFLTEDIQAIFGIIIMPATVMGLLAQFLIHPYLNQIFELYKADKYREIKKILYKIMLVILVIGAICSGVGYLLGTPVLGFVYGLDLSQYSVSLLIILIAATLYTMAGIISPILITMRQNFVQFVIYVVVAIFEWDLSNIFVQKYGFNGAIWAYLITMTIYFVMFYIVAMIIINRKILKSKESEK